MRKRFGLAVLCVILLLAPGCAAAGSGAEEEAQVLLGQLAAGFRADASFSRGEFIGEALVLRDSPRECAITFSKPETIADMTFVFREDNVDVQYLGLQFQFDSALVPELAVANVMLEAFNAAGSCNEEQVNLAETILEVRGVIGAGEFILTAQRQTGHLQKLLIEDEDLKIAFTNFRFL